MDINKLIFDEILSNFVGQKLTSVRTIKTELFFKGNNLAICPRCNAWNAMLTRSNLPKGRDEVQTEYCCRDCDYTVWEENCILVYHKLDKPGMGKFSTCTEISRKDGDNK